MHRCLVCISVFWSLNHEKHAVAIELNSRHTFLFVNELLNEQP